MIFFALALLGGGVTRLFLTVGLIGAIYYFFRAPSWLVPERDWNTGTPLQKWERIAAIEQALFGKVDQDTVAELERWRQQAEKERSNQPLEATSASAPGAGASAPQG